MRRRFFQIRKINTVQSAKILPKIFLANVFFTFFGSESRDIEAVFRS